MNTDNPIIPHRRRRWSWDEEHERHERRAKAQSIRVMRALDDCLRLAKGLAIATAKLGFRPSVDYHPTSSRRELVARIGRAELERWLDE